MSEELSRAAEELSVYLQGELGFTVVDKEDSAIMKAVVTGLDIARFFGATVPDHKAFMENYATTIGTVVGLPKSMRENPFVKIEVVPHEGQHTVQYNEQKMSFPWLFLKNPADRAQFEADAYGTSLAMRWWLTGHLPAVEEINGVLQSLVAGYHLRVEDISYARVAIMSHVESIRNGIYMTKAGRLAIAFMDSKYPHLKGTFPA